jgi:peptidoglycan hydrolase CwlO-like protein
LNNAAVIAAGNSVVVGGIIAAVIAAVGSFVAVAWKFSGRVGSSAADELWKQTQAMYRAQHEMVSDGILRIQRLEGQVDELRHDNEGKGSEIRRLEGIITELRAEVTRLLEKIDRLEKLNGA